MISDTYPTISKPDLDKIKKASKEIQRFIKYTVTTLHPLIGVTVKSTLQKTGINFPHYLVELVDRLTEN